jgi:DNA replication protein DnaC
MSLSRRIRRARFETEATLEGFDFTAAPKLPAAQIRDLAALRWLAAGEFVILYGPVGVGKSHIAQALAHLAIRAGAEARFMKTSRVLAHLAGGKADRTWDKRLAELTRPAVLVLDDFGMRELTAPQAGDLYELITERAGKSLILTSNRAPADWYPLFPNPVVAESLLDRLADPERRGAPDGPFLTRPGLLGPCTRANTEQTCGQNRHVKMTWGRKTPGQNGCAARDLNPEPAD